ncbi:GNAT family N-acetyltransferase [Bifidobacterium amazonense]|uniref:GNAT family N-acetyltransferase n=1 Tax=Bifidobacterium amazonense TaxID=2809027 RepID=A0ABS9VU26_9BIFI|nr:GNAT family N-acetyltransferase [Bifidobacterium amazonense]MCH9275481.1 GNAT family N-acetyltransferase [Bifidobacterium amazonense]
MTASATLLDESQPVGTQSSGTQQPDGIVIREALPDEYPAVGDLLYRAYSSVIDVSERYERDMRDVAGHARAWHIWVAEDVRAGRLVGAVLTPLSAFGPEDQLWHFHSGERMFRLLAVDPQARRRGLGHRLVDFAVERIGALGFSVVGINSGLNLTQAVHLYLRYGFVRHPERERMLYGPGRVLEFTYDIPRHLVRHDPQVDAFEARRGEPEVPDTVGSIPAFLDHVGRFIDADRIVADRSTIDAYVRKLSIDFDADDQPVAFVRIADGDDERRTRDAAQRYGIPVFRYVGAGPLAGRTLPHETGVVLLQDRPA